MTVHEIKLRSCFNLFVVYISYSFNNTLISISHSLPRQIAKIDLHSVAIFTFSYLNIELIFIPTGN